MAKRLDQKCPTNTLAGAQHERPKARGVAHDGRLRRRSLDCGLFFVSSCCKATHNGSPIKEGRVRLGPFFDTRERGRPADLMDVRRLGDTRPPTRPPARRRPSSTRAIPSLRIPRSLSACRPSPMSVMKHLWVFL